MRQLLWLAAVTFCVTTALVYAASISEARRGAGSSGVMYPIQGVTFGNFYKYNAGYPAKQMISDTFFHTWADDGNVYIQSGDTNCGWNCVGSGTNMQWGVASDINPSANIVNANSTNMAEFGSTAQPGSDDATYKPSSTISVHGKMILSAIRQSTDGLVTKGTNLISSTDHGFNWTPLPPATAQPYATMTFADVFGAPFFFQYGQDYVGQTVDRSDQYVYAFSTNRSNRASYFRLGRVLITDLLANPGDGTTWTFYQGGDGALDGNWGVLSTAQQFNLPPSGWLLYGGSPVYLPAFNSYMQITFECTDFSCSTSSTWHFLIAPHPWGPWTDIQQVTWASPGNSQTAFTYGIYWPTIVVKSVATDGGQNITVTANGSFLYPDPATGMETLIMIPVHVF